MKRDLSFSVFVSACMDPSVKASSVPCEAHGAHLRGSANSPENDLTEKAAFDDLIELPTNIGGQLVAFAQNDNFVVVFAPPLSLSVLIQLLQNFASVSASRESQ